MTTKGPTEPMSRATQISDRKRIEAFFREMLRAEPGLAGTAADSLAQRCARRIKRVVVWDKRDARGDRPAIASAPLHGATPAAALAATPASALATPAASPSAPAAVVATGVAQQAAPAAVATTTDAFDPYAFSAVVVLTKAGKDGLMKRLAAIERPEHLRKLADAQHLAVDGALSTTAELRSAIVKAAEQRIANRRAAAS